MNRTALNLLAPLVLAAVCLGTVVLSAAQDLVFRAGIDLVTVDVDVRRGSGQVRGLEAADFVVLDAGVRQTLQTASVEDFPVDVTLVVDTSGSLANLRLGLERDVTRILRILRPIDRLRVLTFGYGVHEALPWQSPGRLRSVLLPPVGRVSAVYDALWMALVRRPDLRRRHLVLALTDGRDLSSVTTSASVLEAASRTDAVLNIVVFPEAPAPSNRPEDWSSVEPDADGLQRLADAAERTGGRLVKAFTAGAPVTSTFERVFNDFRGGYVLSYAYEGPRIDGWHEIEVGINRPGQFNIRARRGYVATR